MSPTIVSQNNRVYLVTRSPEGSTIPTTVLQVIINAIDYGMILSEAVNHPRVHYQGLPNRISQEHEAISAATVRGLKIRGYQLRSPRREWGAAESILVDLQTGVMHGVNNIRKPAGKAVAY